MIIIMNKNEINIINKDWNGICLLENSQRLVRKDILNEYGSKTEEATIKINRYD